ncbi:DUF6912 family protein [Brachybacterium paraconglomeratum]|uniref:DUF6912 family protein n=2 Tax=Dermabacteraceae TaxID=85020 RepID=UPI0008A5E805|nr:MULTISPECIES: hypothetical protein [Brachybacterium]MCT1910465.1 hypothetical protein [Brachybacterium paraconglomeratum]OFT59866.1 hypothetical protein HMPREF3159_06375 [Brachybacterium sp. HMSC06H03]
MRIYLPLTATDRASLELASTRLELPAGRAAWAVTASAERDFPGEDLEDLEYEALQDAVHVAYGAGSPTQRAMVIALDVPDAAIGDAADGGAFGVLLGTPASARIASFHVTELDAAAAEADDTDPALLWFDVVEAREALAYLDGAEAAG